MIPVFIDTSGFYAFLDREDSSHSRAKDLFLRARDEQWILFTSSYVVHESWVLIQARLGWEGRRGLASRLAAHVRGDVRRRILA